MWPRPENAMPTSPAAIESPAVSERAGVRETSRIFALHCLCFVLPFATLGFLLTAPHPWYLALPWFAVIIVSVEIDKRSRSERRQPAERLATWPFDGLLYALVALQFVILGLMLHRVSVDGFWRMDTLIAWLLVGINSGYSAIVVAHELIHRPSRRLQRLGRALLVTVLYEHFYTEHVRGHHARVGTPEDPATARFGETFHHFFARTVPAQLRSAWRLEARRLGDEDMAWWDRRLLQSRVVQGLALEWGVALAILALLGVGAFALYVGQALIAIRLLEAVNYFEHWGLSRSAKKVSPMDSWDTESRFTLYTLVGLSRHADHHAYATRPFQQLRHWDQSPKLPYGYFGMVEMVLFANRKFRDAMTAELRRTKLGPFAEAPTPEA
jgi:alkane 1-monooxygenase